MRRAVMRLLADPGVGGWLVERREQCTAVPQVDSRCATQQHKETDVKGRALMGECQKIGGRRES